VGDEGYTGLDVVRASRIAAIGTGGQVLISDATRAIVAGGLTDGVSVRPIGERQLKDIDRPESIFELVIDDLEPDAAAPALGDEASGAGARRAEAEPGRERRTPSAFADLVKDARQQIESRVLAQLRESLGDEFPFGEAGAQRPPASAARAARSVTREIGRLDRLRRSGALSDEQYQRAVDKLLTDEDAAD
jgi:hypothetical protein